MRTDVLTPEQRHLNMTKIRSQDTKTEMTIRHLLHAAGLRYRLHGHDLPGRPDLVFPKYRAVMFVHGCFWHRHLCLLFKWPKSRQDFWQTKLNRNAERDSEVEKRLLDSGWRVLTVWECSLKGRRRIGPDDLVSRVKTWMEGTDMAGSITGIDEVP